MSDNKTHFGFKTVDENEKADKVAEVFHSVASNYDVMNDVMSVGLHRVWKHFTINTARLNKGDKVLDIAGGTGDLSRGWSKRVGKTGEVWLTDINSSMLSVGEITCSMTVLLYLFHWLMPKNCRFKIIILI